VSRIIHLISESGAAPITVAADTAFIQLQTQSSGALATQSDLGMVFTLEPMDDTIVISQGADETYQITAVDLSAQPVDLTGAMGFFTVKKHWRDIAPLIMKRTLNAGGADGQFIILPQSGATKGKARFFISSIDTSLISADDVDEANNYVYDVWLILASGVHKVVRKIKRFEIFQSVTLFP